MESKFRLPLVMSLSVGLALGLLSLFVFSAANARELQPGPEGEIQSPQASLDLNTDTDIPVDHLVEVIGTDPDGLDPALAYESVSGHILLQVYETLLTYRREKADEFIPLLSTGWTVSPDGRTYIFSIRQGVRFQNGSLMTPSDVAYSFQRGILQGGGNSPQWLFTEALFGAGIRDICELVNLSVCDNRSALQAFQAAHPDQVRQACLDPTARIVANDATWTVTFYLSQAWDPMLATLAGPWGSVVDREWAVASGAWNGDCNTWHNYYAATSSNSPLRATAVGTGPFKLDHWTPGVEVVLTRNNSYWNNTPLWPGAMFGPAALTQVTLPINGDTGATSQMLLDGQVDLAGISSTYLAQLDNATQLAYPEADTITPTLVHPQGTLKRYSGELSNASYDAFFVYEIDATGPRNYVGSGTLDGNGIPLDFFSDLHVRKGFNYAFNYEAYRTSAIGGPAVRRTGPIIRPLPGYTESQPTYDYNPAQALAELNLAWGGR